MTNPGEFDFGPDTVAQAYDSVLVPRMFEPWARSLVLMYDDWHGKTVLDLAAGTGVVSSVVAPRVGPTGCLIAADLNAVVPEGMITYPDYRYARRDTSRGPARTSVV